MQAEEELGNIFTSQEPDVDLHELAKIKSLGSKILEKLNENSESILFVDTASGRQWKGSELREKILNISTALIDVHDFKRGTVVCISYDHSDLSCILALAIICAGGVVACTYPLDPYAELLYLAQKVDPRFLFCHKNNMHWGKKLSLDLKHDVVTIAINSNLKEGDQEEDFPSAIPRKQQFISLFNYDHKKSKSLDRVPVECLDSTKEVAFITMSSGTTGRPKAIPSTHWNVLASLTSKFGSSLKSMKIRFASTASLDYVSGRLIILGAIDSNYTAIIINCFEPKSYCQAIQDYKINLVYLGAAAFYNFITYKHLDQYDLSSILVIFPMGAKIIYLDELRIFFEKYPNIQVVRQGYGTSESSGGAMNSMKPEVYLNDCANCGKLLGGVKVKIVDPTSGKLLGRNKQGLLHISSQVIFPGYYDVKAARGLSTYPFVKEELGIFDQDGYYITGDIAYFNDKEELYIVGREKELMICRGAKKVLPQELEELIDEHPAVFKVCVLGITNKRELTLHCPRAFIVCKESCYSYNSKIEQDDDRILSLISNNNNNDQKEEDCCHLAEEEEKLEFKGQNKLCKLPAKRRRLIARDIMRFVNRRIGWEKQLTGGIVLLDEIGTRGASGKVDKGYLRSLTLDQIEIYGDRSE